MVGYRPENIAWGKSEPDLGCAKGAQILKLHSNYTVAELCFRGCSTRTVNARAEQAAVKKNNKAGNRDKDGSGGIINTAHSCPDLPPIDSRRVWRGKLS